MESANYASYEIGLVRVSSVICKTLNTNFSVNMYYVNIKIKTKNTVGIAKRIVIFLHCSFPVKCLGGRYMGVALCNDWATILIVFCCCLLLIAIRTSCRLEHDKKREKGDFDVHLDEGMEQVNLIALYIVQS